MDKIEFFRLWDLYGKLLTATQQEMCDLYFNLDLTVSEIAGERGISRQSVSECLNLCKAELEKFEKKLGHDKLMSEESRILTGVSRWADEFLGLHPEYAADIASLKEILNEDSAREIDEDLKKSGKE